MQNVSYITCVPLAVCDMSFNFPAVTTVCLFYVYLSFELHSFYHLAENLSNNTINMLVPTRVFFVDMQNFYEYSFCKVL